MVNLPFRAGAARRPSRVLPALVVALAAIATAIPRSLPAAAGALDLSWGSVSGGKVLTDFGGFDAGSAMVVQPDGRVVVAGSSNQTVAVARYLTDGSLDPSFGTAGKTLTSVGATSGASAVAVQPDGKIVVAGMSAGDILVLRYDASGTLDPSFGTGGKVTTAVLGAADNAASVVLQPDGKIVVAGSAQVAAPGTGSDFALVRYSASGALDASFGSGGKVTTDFGGQLDIASALLLRPNGRLVAVGRAFIGSAFQFALAQYDASGHLDPSFGTGGKATSSFSGGTDFALAAALQPDGKIVAAGYTALPSAYSRFGVARYDLAGHLDASFGTAGKVITDISTATSNAAAVLLQPDGKLLVGGPATVSKSGNYLTAFAIVRYFASGAVDPSFGTAGIVTTDFRGVNDQLRALALQADGKPLAAGMSYSGSGVGEFAIVRYGPAGGIDLSWGSIAGGRVLTDLGGFDAGSAMVLQPDGKVVVAGSSNQSAALVRYLSSGALDSSFGSGGKVVTSLPGGGSVSAVALQPDGKIVVAGVAAGRFLVARYSSGGTLDASFGTGGIVTTAVLGTHDSATSVVVQGDGKIVAGGSAQAAVGYDFALVRYDASGGLDAGFGTGGKVTTDFAGNLDLVSALLLRPDGHLVAVGRAYIGTAFRFALAQYDSAGHLDGSFGTGGTTTTTFGGGVDFAQAALLLPDGRLVAAGYTALVSQNPRFALARYDTSGHLDPSFGTGGKVITDISTYASNATAILRQPDGKLVAGGQASVIKTGGGLTAFAVARYSADGAPDVGFGIGGVLTTDFRNVNDQLRALSLQTDGKILAAGMSYHGNSTGEFAVARYFGQDFPAPQITDVFPASGSTSGGTSVDLTGAGFLSGAFLDMEDAAASVTGSSSSSLQATIGAHSAGAVDASVTNPDGKKATLAGGFFYDFTDVPPSSPIHGFVVRLQRNGVTGGCGNDAFCPGSTTTRQQMAVFLLRGAHGAAYVPPPASGTLFTDVPAASPFARWIEELAHEGVSGGCGPGVFCPTSPVSRAQMAVFILRGEHGASYAPPPATGVFADVPASDPFAPWIERVHAEGIAAGCASSPARYCPGDPVTRGQMAVFLVTAFGLP